MAASGVNVGAIVREYFPDADDGQVGFILWNCTGWPSFWIGDPVTHLRQQLQDTKDGKCECLPLAESKAEGDERDPTYDEAVRVLFPKPAEGDE